MLKMLLPGAAIPVLGFAIMKVRTNDNALPARPTRPRGRCTIKRTDRPSNFYRADWSYQKPS